MNASDRRSYDHLVALLADHPEMQFEFAGDAECCRQAVEFAAEAVRKAQPAPKRGMQKQWLLLQMKLKSLFHRLDWRRQKHP